MVEQKILCRCGRFIVKTQLKRHLRTILHNRLLNNEKPENDEKVDLEETQDLEEETEDLAEDFDENLVENLEEEHVENEQDDSFLNELETDKFVNSESKKEQDKKYINDKKLLTQNLTLDDKIRRFNEKSKNKLKNNKELNVDELEILGREKRTLLQKITQYKELFPEELKKLKINKKASVEDLKLVIDEIETILDLSTTDTFLIEGIYASIKIVENVSTLTQNYNVTGLVDILKSNPEFTKICKQLSVKYNMFSKVEPEHKLLFIVSVSCFIVLQKNRKRTELENYLNQPIQK